MAGGSNTRLLLVTANIASCFEQKLLWLEVEMGEKNMEEEEDDLQIKKLIIPDTMLKPWITEFLKTVEEHEPHFIALHCQEVGGKNYEESMQHVEHFIRYDIMM
ncbi:Type I inositol 1,4,5-trisphosphate 5-phosphatase [Portunus trituberculatus]|uniref:Type I inositol 1,4,5-trisphosphate 5-phosphatase n=1 Tax=Portunus trituberculatus TaxID=210409 RepID=A0A5B7FDI6_PORTR|nr:Type I inositol 1,4,5-trisphosphate 5-phosphatase [Portunus trituberculatus]